MNIKTDTPQATVIRHRLYVAGPLLALCAALSFGSALFEGRFQGSVAQHSAISASGTIIGDVALQGTASIAKVESTIIMGAGQMLIASRSVARVEAGNMLITSWNGSFEVTAEESAVTVAALTAPAVVTQIDKTWVVPVGMQLRIPGETVDYADSVADWVIARRPLPLPSHYILKRLPVADALMKSIPEEVMENDSFALSPLIGQTFRLAGARARAEEAVRDTQIEALHRAFVMHDKTTAQTLLMDPAAETALSSEDGQERIPAILRHALSMNMESLILPAFTQSHDLRLLAQYHPEIRSHAWAIASESGSIEQNILSVLLLPSSDRKQEAIADIAVEEWGKTWQAVLNAADDDATLSDAVIASLESDITALNREGYPGRARRYARVLIASSVSDTLGEKAMTSLRRLSDLAEGGVPVTAPVEVAVPAATESEAASVTPEKIVILTPEEIRNLEVSMRQRLQKAGGMFTSKSAIIADENGMVTVKNIVIGGAKGDILLQFTYRSSDDQVINIEQNGVASPYTLTLDRYLTWIRSN
jgi:hypothetical protein